MVAQGSAGPLNGEAPQVLIVDDESYIRDLGKQIRLYSAHFR